MRAVRVCVLILTLMIIITTTGCWGGRETDEVAYVLAIGFDKGEQDELLVTVRVANPRAIAGAGAGAGGEGGGGGAQSTLVLSVESNTPIPTLNLFDISVDRQLSLLHTKAYVFSEELAKEGLGRLLLPLNRYRELRGNSLILVTRGKARDFIENNKPLLELSPTKQFELIRELPGTHGLYSITLFQQFYNDIKSLSMEGTIPLVAIREEGSGTAGTGARGGGEQILGKYTAGEVPIKGGNRAQIMGNAVFRRDRMVGEISGEEARYLLILQGGFKRGKFSVADPLAAEPMSVALMVIQARGSKIRTTIEPDGSVAVDVDIYLEPEIIGIMSGVNYETEENKPILEEAISREIEQGCRNLIQRTQKEFRSDIVGFGKHLKHHFWTSQPWEEFQWLARYPEAQVNVTVHTQIRRTGFLLKTTPIRGGE